MSSIRSFIPLQKLGQGTYSNVYKVRRVDDNQIYALKKVKLNSLNLKQKQNALNQVRILASIQSPNIIAYKQAFFDQSLNVLCVVMEFATDGDLQKYIKTYTKTFKLIEEQQIWKAAQHILKGLQNLHSRGILHRDIKCANIFKSKGVYKLGDLNVSKVNGDKLAYTQTGTPYYASPEVWRDQPYDSKSDIWSFGCIIYEMASLKPPFNGKDMQDLYKNVQKGKVAKLTNHYSQDLWEFIQLCLQKDPKRRPSASQLIKVLKKHYSNTTSGIKINNPESNQLLKTIKLPHDLKKLNEALPTSKYRKSSQIVQSKIIDSYQSKLTEKHVNQNKSAIVMQSQKKIPQNSNSKNNCKLQNQKDFIIQKPLQVQINSKNNKNSKQNKSAIYNPLETQLSPKHKIENIIQNSYRSPKSKVQTYKLYKSPASQVRLGKKVQSSLGYSDRLQKSDRKPSTASKVEHIRYEMEMDIKNLAQQLKKPISMPRTEKKTTIINNSHLIQNSYDKQAQYSSKKIQNNRSYMPSNNYHSSKINGHIISANQKYESIQNLRNKLLKKNRILSSQVKPSWW